MDSSPVKMLPLEPPLATQQQPMGKLQDIGNQDKFAMQQWMPLSSQCQYLEPSKIQSAFASARLSAFNDENRLIQSPWLTRGFRQEEPGTGKPVVTSSLSVLQLIDLCINPPLHHHTDRSEYF